MEGLQHRSAFIKMIGFGEWVQKENDVLPQLTSSPTHARVTLLWSFSKRG